MEIVRCNEEDYETLAGIWERSVMATHDFLKEEDFNEIKAASDRAVVKILIRQRR